MLAKLCFCILSLPHGNADPERGFSLNKNILGVHGFSIKEETLESVRLVKDFIIRSGGLQNITVCTELMESCKASHTRYLSYLDEQRKIIEEIEAKKKEVEEKKVRKEESTKLNVEKDTILKSMKVADKCIEEGNIELESITKSKVINRDELIRSQNKISLGLKRKAELASDLELVEKKIKQCLK